MCPSRESRGSALSATFRSTTCTGTTALAGCPRNWMARPRSAEGCGPSCTGGPRGRCPRGTASRCKARRPPRGGSRSGTWRGRPSTRRSTPWRRSRSARGRAGTRARTGGGCPRRSLGRRRSSATPRRRAQEEARTARWTTGACFRPPPARSRSNRSALPRRRSARPRLPRSSRSWRTRLRRGRRSPSLPPRQGARRPPSTSVCCAAGSRARSRWRPPNQAPLSKNGSSSHRSRSRRPLAIR
mmetsp:Transcript_33751/g.94991  ORF Transcript_33751/g.94991 Transcript_33751/m.94991 type:complete len:242 (-) Transcript_33751:888-1613(-)